MTPIDWTPFDKYPEDQCECRCGEFFSSHAKFVLAEEPCIMSRKACPACGRHELRGARSGWSSMVLEHEKK